jgi:hypothetical protein
MLSRIKKLVKADKKETILIYENPELRVIKCSVTDIDKHNIVNWSKNRQPDNVRITDLSKYYAENSVRLIPGVIYAWQRSNTDKLEIYDGIHRLLAAYEYGENMTCILSIRITNDESEIIKDFTCINKSVSVPSIYLEETNVFKKIVCQNVAEMLCKQYPTFVSPSRKPYVYNFNRDNLIEFISSLDVDFCKPRIDKYIFNELMGLNLYAERFVERNSITHPKKCAYYKFYLFYLDKTLIKSKIEEALTRIG